MKTLRFLAIMVSCSLAGTSVFTLGITRHGATEMMALAAGVLIEVCMFAIAWNEIPT